MGTMTYVAPEMITSADTRFQIESDMWSLGVIVFTLLAGRHPFYSSNNTQLFNLIQTCDYQFEPKSIWENVSNDCKDFIEELLEPNKESRLTPV